MNATRRLCRTGALAFSQHGKCIEIPVEAVRPQLRSTTALRRLDELAKRQIAAPRVAKPSQKPAPLTETGS